MVYPNGVKYQHFAYRFDDKQKNLALVIYLEVSLAMAREGSDEAQKIRIVGIDPSANRKATKEAQT